MRQDHTDKDEKDAEVVRQRTTRRESGGGKGERKKKNFGLSRLSREREKQRGISRGRSILLRGKTEKRKIVTDICILVRFLNRGETTLS